MMTSNNDPHKLVQIELSPVKPCHSYEYSFDIATVAGRDEIADQIKADIDEYSKRAFYDGPRSHLGASEIGHNCAAYLWYKFRWAFEKVPEGRIARLFRRGHLEEIVISDLLRAIGFSVEQVDIDGQQFKVARTIGGHFGGSTDGRTSLPSRYKGSPDILVLLEFKAMGDKGFQPIYDVGYQKAHAKYWMQSCVYARKLGLKYILFIANNKNDDELNIELVEADWELAAEAERKAEYIITSETRPVRLSDNASYYECRYCDAAAVCHYNREPLKNCRSCQAAVPTEEGEWHCRRFQQNIPKDFIPKGCNQWVPIR